VEVIYKENSTIVEDGQVITQVQFDAITELNLNGRTTTQYLALLVATATIMAVLAFYISRFRPGVWASLRRVTLLGLLLVMLALSIRAAAALGSVMEVLNLAGGYAVPAAAFGVMVAILFDARMAVLIAVAAASITALATGDPGYTIYALLSGFVPVPFVASISRRADLVVPCSQGRQVRLLPRRPWPSSFTPRWLMNHWPSRRWACRLWWPVR
jgi:membrane-associated HD superfamily phosphohydrolase